MDDLTDAVENFLIVRLHLHRVGPLAEHQEQYRVGDEVEPWEPRALLLQVALETLLALFELHEEHRERRAQGLAGAAGGDLLDLFGCVRTNVISMCGSEEKEGARTAT